MPDYKLINSIEEGMVLAESVTNNYGQLMIPLQTKISTKHIKLLKLWKVQGVLVMNKEDKIDFQISPKMRKKLRDKILSKFSISNNKDSLNVVFNDLVEMGIIFHAKKLNNETN